MSVLIVGFSCGISINKHYCGGKLESTTIFSWSDCGSCGNNKGDVDNCCQNVVIRLKTDQQFSPVFFTWKIDTQNFFADLASLYQAINWESKTHFSNYLNYKPPLLFRDISVLVQSFLL